MEKLRDTVYQYLMYENDHSREAAEISLAALSFTLKDLPRLRGFMMLPDLRVLERSRVADALADSPKPLFCIGVPMFGCVGVGCWTEAPGVARRNSVDIDARNRRFDPASKVSVPRTMTPGEFFMVPMAAVEAWARDYDLPQVGFSILEADSATAAAGADFMLRFEPTDESYDSLVFVWDQVK